MRAMFVFIVGLVLVACATTNSRTDTSSGSPELWEVPLTDEEKLHIDSVEADGRILYRKDQYAARATRLLMNAISLADYPNFVGWIGYEDEHIFVVSFYGKTEDQVTLVADVHFSDDAPPHLEANPDRPLSERELSMLNARMAAMREVESSCSDRANTVIMPATEDEETWLVYVLAATTNPDLILVGGHSRVRVDKISAEVVDVERLSYTCLTLDKSQMDSGSEQGIAVVTHNVTPMPVPIHPFLSLLHDRPILVLSERGRWLISGHEISMM